jgi:glycosyltransferase involved in cell wall biosynthesis
LQTSLIICSRNRRLLLAESLKRLPAASIRRNRVEVVLVDSASTDGTHAAMQSFAASAPFAVRTAVVARPGGGLARGRGVGAASGDFLVFTDDDCYLPEDYFDRLLEVAQEVDFQFGGGSVELFDAVVPAIGVGRLQERRLLPPGTLLGAGTIQGGNMFFRRTVFERAGLFRGDFGAGARFSGDDIEMATRASLAGFVGIVLPGLKVYHDNPRRPGTRELAERLEQYDHGRGAYYASLLAAGHVVAWQLWGRVSLAPAAAGSPKQSLKKLERELRGAADFIAGTIGQD